MSSGMLAFGCNFVLSLIALPLYLHFLGYERYGIWLVLTTVMSFAQLGNFGIGSAVAKYVAEYYAKGDMKSIRCYVTTAVYSLTFSGLLIFLMILAFRQQIVSAFKLSGDYSILVLQLLPYVGMLTIYVFVVKIVETTLSGLNRMDLASYFRLVGRGIALIVSAILLYRGMGVKSLLIATFISETTSQMLFLHTIRSLIPVSFFDARYVDKASFKRLLAFGAGVMGGSTFEMLVSPLNKLIISRYIGVGAIPIFDIAYNVAMNIRGIAASGLGALTPEVSRLSALSKSDAERIPHIYRKTIKIILFVGMPSFLVVFALATPLLQIWLRARFNAELPTMLRIMLVGAFLNLYAIPSYYVLMGRGRTDKLFFFNIVKSGVNVLVLSILLVTVSTLSITAVGWATVMGMGCSTIYLLRQNQKVTMAVAK
ncbi:MAG: oligosaccharide flippase family protein [Candidatus Sulfobium sp.]